MNNPAENGNISLCGTLFLGIVSWLTPENIDMGLKVVTGIGALVSAILAARYYWYATKEKEAKFKEDERLMKKFFQKMMDSNDPMSSKRFITLVVAGHFILSSFCVLFVAVYVIFFTTKGTLQPTLLSLLNGILEYDFYIILSGLGFVTAENFGQMMIEKVKAKLPILPNPPEPPVVQPPEDEMIS